MMSVDDMKPGRMVAVGDMLMALFPLQHEELWTTGMEGEGGPESRVHCRCGWISPLGLEMSAQVSRFIDHLVELQNAQ